MTRPGILSGLAIAAPLALLAGCAPTAEPVDLPAPPVFEQQILEQINALRSTDGVAALDGNDCLTARARVRAAALPAATTAPLDDLPMDCGDYDYGGENVSRSDQSAVAVVDTWAADATQSPNLVDPAFEVVGVGCVAMAAADTSRVADVGEDVAGMACSVIFEGYQP